MSENVKSEYDQLAWEWLRILTDQKIKDSVKEVLLLALEKKMETLDEKYATQI